MLLLGIGGFDLLRYKDKWKISGFGNGLANLSSDGYLNKITLKDYLEGLK